MSFNTMPMPGMGKENEENSKEDFNLKHPEMQPDEIFLGNFERENEDYDEENMQESGGRDLEADNLGWQTMRKGMTAYDINGNKIMGMYPVFIKNEEWETRGRNRKEMQEQ